MKRLYCALLAIASTSALAATPIDETIDGVTGGTLDIENVSGSVTVSGTNGDAVHVTGELGDDVERLDFRQEGDRVIVHVILMRDGNNRTGNIRGTTLEIVAPRAMALRVDTVSASVRVDGIEGDEELSTVSGSVETALGAGELRAQSVSGRIRVSGSNASTRSRVSSVSGAVTLDDVGGEVTAETVSGRVEITSDSLERGDVQAVSGSVDIDAALADDAQLRATTTSGSIRLSIRAGGEGQYEISTLSGSIDNCFGPTPTRSSFGPPNATLRFSEGDSNARVSANSMSGRVELCRDR